MTVGYSLFMAGTRLALVKELVAGDGNGGLNKTRIGLLSVVLAAVAFGLGAVRHPLWAKVLGVGKYAVKNKVEGEVAPGFEAVREAFQQNVDEGLEHGAQFAVYYKGRKVVDLHGGTLGDKYDGESLQFAFSLSKNLAAIVVARLVADGHLDYNAKVSKYWPEFAQNGKEDITVADVLRHEAGLPYRSDGKLIPGEMFHTSNLDESAALMAGLAPVWTNKDSLEPHDRIYHAATRGLLLQEIVRRADPQHRTVGQIIRQEIAQPMGITAAVGDLTPEERERVWRLDFNGIPHFLISHFFKLITGQTTKEERDRFGGFGNTSSELSLAWNAIDMKSFKNPNDWFNDPLMYELEILSANVYTNALSVAKIADAMARRDMFDAKTHAAAESEPIVRYDKALFMETAFTKGGFCKLDAPLFDPVFNSFYGWGGFGGNLMAWSNDLELAIAYVMNGNIFSSIFGAKDPRCIRLSKALLKCIEAQEAKSA